MPGQPFSRTVVGRTDANGNATLFFDGPGNDLIIDGITVSTATNAKEPTCKLFMDTTNAAGFLGGTNVGSYDSASPQLGMTAGQSMLCVWADADASTTVTLAITGTQYPPGTGPAPTGNTVIFNRTIAGASGGWKLTQIAGATATLATPAASHQTAILDVRPYAAFNMAWKPTVNGVATAYNPVSCELIWYADSAGTTEICRDYMELFAEYFTIPFDTTASRIFHQDPMHGPYMRLLFTNNGTDSCAISYNLFGTDRQLTAPYNRQISAADALLLDLQNIAIGAGQTFTEVIGYGYGRVMVEVTTGAAMNLNWFAGSKYPTRIYSNPALNGQARFELVFPKRQVRVEIQNPGGASAYTIAIVRQLDSA